MMPKALSIYTYIDHEKEFIGSKVKPLTLIKLNLYSKTRFFLSVKFFSSILVVQWLYNVIPIIPISLLIYFILNILKGREVKL